MHPTHPTHPTHPIHHSSHVDARNRIKPNRHHIVENHLNKVLVSKFPSTPPFFINSVNQPTSVTARRAGDAPPFHRPNTGSFIPIGSIPTISNIDQNLFNKVLVSKYRSSTFNSIHPPLLLLPHRFDKCLVARVKLFEEDTLRRSACRYGWKNSSNNFPEAATRCRLPAPAHRNRRLLHATLVGTQIIPSRIPSRIPQASSQETNNNSKQLWTRAAGNVNTNNSLSIPSAPSQTIWTSLNNNHTAPSANHQPIPRHQPIILHFPIEHGCP